MITLKNNEYENLVIKGLFSNKEFLKRVTQRNITKDIFTIPINKFLYETIVNAYRKTFNIPSIEDIKIHIQNSNGDDESKKIRLTVLENAEKTLNAIQDQPNRYNYVYTELIDLYKQRKFVEINEFYLNSIKNSSIKPDRLYQKVQNELNKVRQETGEIEVRRLDAFSKESIDERIKQYDIDKQSPNSNRIPYPFPTMNDITGGINNTDLIIFAARQKVGKSIMLLNVAHHLISTGYNGVYITIEQSKEEILAREDSLATQLLHREIRLRTLNPGEHAIYKQKLKELSTSINKLIIVDVPRGCTVDLIEAELRSITEDGIKLDFCVVDYLGLIGSENGEKDPIKTMGFISMQLKQLAREMRIPIITAQQMNRESEKDKKKTNRGIAYSDQQGAHVNAMFAMVPGKDPNKIQIQTVLARDFEYFDLNLLTRYEMMLIVEDKSVLDDDKDMTVEESDLF